MKICLLFALLWCSAFAANNYLFEGNTINIEEKKDGFTYKVYRKSDTITARFSFIGELLDCSHENQTVSTLQARDNSQDVYQMIKKLITLGVPRDDVLRITYAKGLMQLCSMSRKVRRFKRQAQWNSEMFIFPGTKWCGRGKTATSYDQLGEEREADTCCRAHDNCPNSIVKGRSYLGLRNGSPFTVNSCECDETFKTCLQYADTTASNIIGDLFFNRIGMICYRVRVSYCTDPKVRSKCSPQQRIYRGAYAAQLPRWNPHSNSYDDYE